MLPSKWFGTLNSFLQVKRWVLIALAAVLISACGSQIPPIVSPTAGGPTAGSATQTSQIAFPTFTATLTPKPTNTSTPSLEPTEAIAEIVPFIPVTGPTLSPSTDSNDKFQNFEIPVTGDEGGFLIPVTGFPQGVITRQDVDLRPVYDSIDLSLKIPSLEVDIPILGVSYKNGTWDISWLWEQAGWLEGTAYPTRNGNSIVTAHVVTADGKDGPFVHLKALGIGEYVFVNGSGYSNIYQVISNEIVEPNDASVFSHEVDPILTLITCDLYDEETKTYLARVIVRAKRVATRPIN